MYDESLELKKYYFFIFYNKNSDGISRLPKLIEGKLPGINVSALGL